MCCADRVHAAKRNSPCSNASACGCAGNSEKTHASLQRRPAKDAGRIERRIGRWLGRFPAAERLLEVQVERDAAGCACGLKITEREERSAWAGHAQGAYLLRTNCPEQDPAKLWRW